MRQYMTKQKEKNNFRERRKRDPWNMSGYDTLREKPCKIWMNKGTLWVTTNIIMCCLWEESNMNFWALETLEADSAIIWCDFCVMKLTNATVGQ